MVDAVSVDFLDCETVRITGTAEDVILSAFWWDESRSVGTIAEPIGGVDGRRVVSVSEEFGAFAYGPIVSEIEGFEPGTPRIPGNGDWSVSNPDLEDCVAEVRDRYELPQPFPE
ncbi:hypothetical protein [Halobiforma nitratireducens]|uniref:Uncharacterized protein n=1 Tax=Halobiforma nitratireducens JCM 10879 TaxID=1227454 RepID=M0L9C4_9EURY|nr:hypothetical protein [Halobiforma nitratireducens]EMA30202.1 hypothetical protein C446_16747 [Halobiforma nitratireducens JCM 10879]